MPIAVEEQAEQTEQVEEASQETPETPDYAALLDSIPEEVFIAHRRVQSEAERRTQQSLARDRERLAADNERWRQEEMDKAIYDQLTKLDPEDLDPKSKEWLNRFQNEHLTKTLRPQVETEVHSKQLLPVFMPLYEELPDTKKRELAPAAYAAQHGYAAWYRAVADASLEHRTATKQSEWQKDENQRIAAALEADRAARRATAPAPDLTNGNGSTSTITMADYLRMSARERNEWDKSHNAEEKKAMEATWR